MNLSNDLVNKFVEITNDETPNKEGSTAYGVTVQYGDRMYVKLDGSDLLTPVVTTSAIKSGERVTVLIKDHNATVTGNLSDPSASSKDLTDVGDKIAEVDILIADKVDTKILVAETARIEELIATKASIGQLEADRAEIEHLIANKAEITDLEAINADIEILDAEVADIETLVNGHLTSDNIHSLVLTSDKVTVDDAFIKDAMIANVSANKITSGQINTSLVSISSEDGSMTLNGSTQQFKDSEGTVRIQIGKDAEGNFTFCLFSQDGVGILLDEEGIHAGAVPDGLIVNDMVADNANISGGKLDINSVITSINNGDTSIDSSRIYLDEESQSLKVAFNSLKTKVDTIEETTVDGDLSTIIEQINSNTTNIEVMQGEISSLISNTTITKENGEVVQLKDEYNSIKNTVDSHATKIGSLETTVDDVSSKQASMELDLDGFKTTVYDTYSTKAQLNTTNNNVTTAQNTADTAKTTADSALSKANTNATNISTVSNKQASMELDLSGFKTEVSNTYATTTQLNTTNNNVTTAQNTADSALSKANTNATNITTVSNNQSTLEQTVNNFKTTVSNTYATKDELTGLESSYVTKTEFNQTNEDFTFKISQNGGGNLLRNSDFYDVMNEKWDYWTFWGNCYQYTDIWLEYESFEDAMIIDNQSTNTDGGFYQEILGIKPNVEYTLSANLSWGSNVKGVTFAIEYYTSSGSRISNKVHSIENDIDIRQYFTFTTPEDCARVRAIFNHKGSTNGLSAFYVIQRPCLVEGYGSVWVPHSKEIYDGIVKIDKSGLTVQHGTNSTVLDSNSLKIKVGSDTHAQIKDGRFTFTDASGSNTLGRVGRSYWANTSIGMTSLGASYGNTIALSAQHESNGNFITGIVCSSKDQWIGSSYYYRGVDITFPVVTDRMRFRDAYKNCMQTYDGNSIGMLDIWAYDDSSYGYGGIIAGNNYLKLSIYSGGVGKSGFVIREDNTQSNNAAIHGYGPLNMHGYSITNSTSTMSLNAQSGYARSLLSTGTNEQISYSGLNYNSDEIRWCWKENVFTYPECDVDPETDEWVYTGRNICYVELPIFMAENIEAYYHINVGKVGWGDYRIIEKNQYYFILESQEEDFAFTFEVVAKLKDGATITNNAIVANNSITTEDTESIPQDIEWVVDPVDSINIQENINKGE